MIPNKKYNANEHIRELVDSSCQGVKKLFVLTDDNVNGITADSHKRYFLPRIKIKKYSIKIDGMQIQKQFNELFLQVRQVELQQFFTFLNNSKKQ